MVGAWNVRHALRNGIAGEWAITVTKRIQRIDQGDKAVVYVLKKSEHNPSGIGAGCFIGDFTIDSGPLEISGPWIWADHTFDERTWSQGFKLKDFRLWETFVSKDEALNRGAGFDLGKLRAGRGLMQISREAYLKIADAYAEKIEQERKRECTS